MDDRKVISELDSRFPGHNIVQIPPENPREIICEIEPTAEHDEYSVAVAVIERSVPHHHKRSTETYRILVGRLILLANDKQVTLNPGEKYVVRPGVIHSAMADPLDNPAWVEVTSEPGWRAEDHIIDKLDSDQPTNLK